MTLVFDTETTGKADFKKPPEHECQPRLVQLGAILFDDHDQVTAEVNLIAKPVGFVIPQEASDIHGIDQARAERYGVSELAILHLFNALCNRATTLVAHNIFFDGLIIGRAMRVHELDHKSPPIKFCTMNAMTPVCKLPGRYRPDDYKWPSLAEAHTKAFGTVFEGAHNAMADVRACARVYFWLKAQGLT